jgi:hypothetical protein
MANWPMQLHGSCSHIPETIPSRRSSASIWKMFSFFKLLSISVEYFLGGRLEALLSQDKLPAGSYVSDKDTLLLQEL